MICPTNCIKMVEDTEGFLYPFRNYNFCIDCGLCEEVCPFIQKQKIEHNTQGYLPKAFLALHKDEKVVFHSSSGGVFSAVANAYYNKNYIIFGAQFDENLKVIHSFIQSLEGIEKYRKSKYVQSDINNSYKQAEIFLRKGKRVLFTGTPCQIAGLRLYLRKEYENLFCLDLVCHGVPSQKVFDKYIQYFEIKCKEKVIDFIFRHKTIDKNGQWNSKNVKIVTKNRIFVIDSGKDKFLKGFHQGLFYRPSCYNCKYATPTRVSDFTMADFWGVERLFPEMDVHRGVSVLVVNSNKGEKLLKKIENIMILREVEYNYVIQCNIQLKEPVKLHPMRELFFETIDKNRFDLAVNNCIPQPFIIKRIMSRLLPPSIKKIIKKILFRGKNHDVIIKRISKKV